MKTTYLALIATLALFQSSFAQWTTNTSSTITSTNNTIGIGTSTPQAVLDVGTWLNPGDLGAVLGRLGEGNTSGSGTFLGVRGYATQGSGDIKSFSLEHSFYGTTNSSINFFRGGGITGGFISFNTNNNSEAMRITSTGNVSIGTTDPGIYKFGVNGTIHSKAVVVDLNGWTDYVFKPTYNLRPLSEVKTYIDKNHHLPDIPSEKEVVEKGLDLGIMNKLLTKKVEELTLYLIEKDKMINKQQEQINHLNQQMQIILKKIK